MIPGAFGSEITRIPHMDEVLRRNRGVSLLSVASQLATSTLAASTSCACVGTVDVASPTAPGSFLNVRSMILSAQSFDRFFGLAHVLLEWQRGKIEDDGIKPSPGRFYGLRQGMGMIRVKKDWAVAFLPQTPHQSRNLSDSEKLPFALGRTDHHRDLQFLPECQHRLQ